MWERAPGNRSFFLCSVVFKNLYIPEPHKITAVSFIFETDCGNLFRLPYIILYYMVICRYLPCNSCCMRMISQNSPRAKVGSPSRIVIAWRIFIFSEPTSAESLPSSNTASVLHEATYNFLFFISYS